MVTPYPSGERAATGVRLPDWDRMAADAPAVLTCSRICVDLVEVCTDDVRRGSRRIGPFRDFSIQVSARI
jgi:hypothetical protein